MCAPLPLSILPQARNGHGADLNTEWQLSVNTSSMVLMSPTGARWILAKDVGGVYRKAPGLPGIEGAEDTTNGAASVVARTDAWGIRLAVGRSSSAVGLVQSITDGTEYRFTYTVAGNLRWRLSPSSHPLRGSPRLRKATSGLRFWLSHHHHSGENMKINRIAASVLLCTSFGAQAQEAIFTTASLTPETALNAAQAALAHCRKIGYQVAVAVVDKSGLPQVMLRDRYAGTHTAEVSVNKAWTAVSFKTSTATLAEETQPGKPMSGLRNSPRFLAAGGGLMIEGAGALLGGIGVSGAPGGEADEACAQAGIQAIADLLEF